MKYTTLTVLITTCFIFCVPQEKELTFRDEQGRLCKLVGIDAHNACYTFYYDDDESIRRKICLKDSLAYGLDQFFYQSGSLYRSAYYQHDTLVGMDTFYHETGEIDYIVDGYKDQKVNGTLYIYSKDSTLKAINLVENDSVYYIKTYTYDANKSRIDSNESYNFLIETNKDTFQVNDTATIRLYLPKCNAPLSIDQFVANYDFFIVDDKIEKYSSPLNKKSLTPEGIIERILCAEAGQILIAGHLDYVMEDGTIIQHGISEKFITIMDK